MNTQQSIKDLYESSFEGFGYREIREAAKLLNAYLESDIEVGILKVCFNPNSGYVFLSDDDYNVWMFNNDKLEMFYTCHNCGYEGFKNEFKNENECPDCQERLF